MKVAILGTRGIPNSYGGFEQFAQYLSFGLVQEGFDVTVYNSHCHPYKESNWNDVKIVHSYDPENKIGTIGQFIYDLNCILDCRKKNFDIVLQLGYTSSSVWFRLLDRNKCVVTTNMDGLEWKRSKYTKHVQQFLKFAEKLAVKHSHHLIADSGAIKKYLKSKYNADSTFIPYGANVFNDPDEGVLKEYGLSPFAYDVLVARLEPENSIEIILEGFLKSSSKRTFVVIGNNGTKYGDYLKNKFSKFQNINFWGSIYDINKLNNIRYYSCLYFHGHTVGGTNPSLLEAMASHALICAHDNVFNNSILKDDGYYFKTPVDVAQILEKLNKTDVSDKDKISNNIKKIESTYCWPKIVQQYIEHFRFITSKKIEGKPQVSFIKSNQTTNVNKT